MSSEQIKEQIWEFLESSLNLGPSSVIGIDLGSTHLRMVEILDQGSSNYKLNKYGSVPIPSGTVVEGQIILLDELKTIIMNLKDELSISNKNICIGISGPYCLSKRMQVGDGSLEEITDQVMWESEQYIPFGIDESNISFFIQGENEGGGNDCLMAAARNEELDGLNNLFDQCNLKLKIIDLDIIALCNMYFMTIGNDRVDLDDGYLLLDLGAIKTNMALVQGDRIIFTREINLGGKNITEEIQRGLSLSYAEAEDLKASIDDEGHGVEDVLSLIQNSIAQFTTEIKKTINFFTQTETDIAIVECFITGGNSKLYGFKKALEEDLDLPVDYFHPFNYISINEKNIEKDQLKEISRKGIVALGLGLRRIHKNK